MQHMMCSEYLKNWSLHYNTGLHAGIYPLCYGRELHPFWVAAVSPLWTNNRHYCNLAKRYPGHGNSLFALQLEICTCLFPM